MTKKIREIRIDGNIAYVSLTRGYEAIIDATDVLLVEGWKWTADVKRRKDGSIRTIYAHRQKWLGKGKQRKMLMHRVLAGTPDGFETDHRDGDGLNNRRANLRTATKSQNMHNSRVRSDNTSGVKGVVWDKLRSRWRAEIVHNGKGHFLGRFDTIESAAAAVAEARAQLHGAFARTE